MHDEVTRHAAGIRERVIVFLAFLTSEACRDAFRTHVAQPDWAATLCRIWFDEVYVPGTQYLEDGLKGDRSTAALRAFEAAFTPEERAMLERFHGCLELRLDLLANRQHGRARFPDNDSWRRILHDARALLHELEPNPERIQALLAALLSQPGGRPLPLPWNAG
ncbi:MAG: hypothetical protein KatS3mg043_1239 [Rhodothermaceae bacterium]|nr:MAG: hypothetical protein KatS3mg043_1239 [Rhodothermaceae bacterium]